MLRLHSVSFSLHHPFHIRHLYGVYTSFIRRNKAVSTTPSTMARWPTRKRGDLRRSFRPGGAPPASSCAHSLNSPNTSVPNQRRSRHRNGRSRWSEIRNKSAVHGADGVQRQEREPHARHHRVLDGLVARHVHRDAGLQPPLGEADLHTGTAVGRLEGDPMTVQGYDNVCLDWYRVGRHCGHFGGGDVQRGRRRDRADQRVRLPD